MADINKESIKLMQSQRLDDTEQGGGQMTAFPVLSGEINNLFPDISRLDRVYGRVSIRKAYAAVQTDGRETYYGSHTILTEQAKDPNVSICFFSSEDWFDTRDSAKDRIEGYLVRGTLARMSLWGPHYEGTNSLSFLTIEDSTLPDIGDVLVLKSESYEQYIRIIDLSYDVRSFYIDGTANSSYKLKIVSITIGNALEADFAGVEAGANLITSNDPTLVYNTAAADSSKYYGVSSLVEDAALGNLQFRVSDVMEHLVPSAASETAIVDAGIGVATSPLIQTKDNTNAKITRSLSFSISNNSKLYVGEGVKRGTFEWSGGGLTLTDDSNGNVLNGSQVVGAISYGTGTVTFVEPGVTISGTGNVTYVPVCSPSQVSQTGGIIIETANRGFVYTFNCDPIPEPGTLKVEYLAGGKWYTMWDQGNGKIAGLEGYDVGSGTLNFNTGSLSVTLKSSPDVNSKILFFWAKPAEYYDFSGESLPLRYKFNTNNPSVARNTFELTWNGDNAGPGLNGEYCIVDDGYANLTTATWDVSLGWEATENIVGNIKYATGEIDTGIHASQFAPKASEIFSIKYNYGEPENVVFEMPPRNSDGTITLNLTNLPIIPGTFRIEWHTDVAIYDPKTRFDPTRDPAYIFFDRNGSGSFDGDHDDGTVNWIMGNVNYATGEINFMPDRKTVFPHMEYEWKITKWIHPGVEESYVFDHILYLPTASIFPPDRSVSVSYCTTDGTNQDEYSGTLSPIYLIKEDSGLEIVPGGLGVSDGSLYMIDGTDGRLYTHVDGVDGSKTEVGTINYANKTFIITSDSVNIRNISVRTCVGTAALDPTMSMVFRAPGSPIRSGSAFIKAVNSEGTIIEGNAGFDGSIIGSGISGSVDHDTGVCTVVFGEWVLDDATAQAAEWYSATASDGSGNVWKPYSVSASSVIMNCVVTSYLPLDPDLLGLNPVRLPLDGKVPIFRDGYIVAIHHSDTEILSDNPVQTNVPYYVGRHPVDLLEVYDSADDPETGQEYSDDFPEYVPDGGNYTVDLENGTVTFLDTFSTGAYRQPFRIFHRIEDMALASDVQITGHIAITSALTHSYEGIESNPDNPTLVSSVLPSADLQSRAYNEFEQEAWSGSWSDNVIGSQPLASFNFVDFPITVINKPSIKERWLILFTGPTTVSIIGENFGYMKENVTISTSGLPEWSDGQSGAFNIDGIPSLIVASNQFSGYYYWKMPLAGFGVGWQSGNCIRFNQDAANFPIWFIRTTLQAPATEPVDSYTIQVRGDSS